MIKGKATLEFKFYRDIGGMEMYILEPSEPEEAEAFQEEDNQEELDLEPDDASEVEEAVEDTVEEEADPVEETPEKPANTGYELVLTPYKKGLSTGSRMTVNFECSKDQMRSLMDAEAMGLAPCFTFSIQ
jgi:hypothetical protein